MRRRDREICSVDEIFGMLSRCTVARIAVNTEGAPYVVPMTFGCSLENGKISVYFHCAGEGRKLDLLAKDNRVCVEADNYIRVEETDGGITARYESVIGWGRCVEITDAREKLSAVKCVLDHYEKSGFPAESCKGMNMLKVLKVTLDEVTGKRNREN